MPRCREFEFNVLIGGEKVKEYEHGGETLIESNLFTPVSYQCPVKEYANGELECQSWPVTPYEIQITVSPQATSAGIFYTYVDGAEVDRPILTPGQTKIIRGFNETDGTKEFLFSLPRFAKNEKDRIEANQRCDVGTIKVEMKKAIFFRYEEKYSGGSKCLSGFNQANKKDANVITGGKYVLATTKIGRQIASTPYENPKKKRSCNIYDIGNRVALLSVKYHMKHTLEDLGITVEAR